MTKFEAKNFILSHFIILTLSLTFICFFTDQLQADPDANAPPKCVTNTDADGAVIAGHFGLVTPPEPFSSVVTEGGDLTVYPDLRYGQGALIYSGVYRGFYSAGGPSQTVPEEGSETKVVFKRDDGTIAHVCMVKAVQFDPTVHDPQASQVGKCYLKQIAGVQTLVPGHVQIFELPFELIEISGVPGTVLETVPITTELIQLRGQSAGWANYVWHPKNTAEFGGIGGICNVLVSKSNSVRDDQLLENMEPCLDVNSKAVSLKVGDKSTLKLIEYRNNINFWQGSLTQRNPPIQIVTPIEFGTDTEQFEVEATKAGSISLVRVLLKDGRLRYDTCKITVR